MTKTEAFKIQNELDFILNNSTIYENISPNILNSTVVTNQVMNHLISSKKDQLIFLILIYLIHFIIK